MALKSPRLVMRSCAFAASLMLCSLGGLAHADASRPILVVQVDTSYPSYALYEYRYWPSKTVVCKSRGPSYTKPGDPDPIQCRRRFFDRHRSSVLALIPQLAQIGSHSPSSASDECIVLDGDTVTISGLWQGKPFQVQNRNLGPCESPDNKLVDQLVGLVY